MDEQDQASLLGAIAETRVAFADALRRGDAADASAVYAERATLLAPSAELIQGRTAIEAFWRAGIEAGVSEIDLQALEVKRQNGLAFEVGRYALRLDRVEGGSIVEGGKYVLVHERQRDGCWRWAVEMFNPDAPPAQAGGRPKEGDE